MYLAAITLLCLVAVAYCYHYESDNKRSAPDYLRSKRQEGPWIWGKIPENNKIGPRITQPQISTTTPVEAKAPRPCDPFEPPTRPDFRRGRRISETKCLEYIWEIKVRADNETHDAECTKWRAQFWGRRFVIGGKDTIPGEYPHMGALGWQTVQGNWIFKCGCSLISSKFVVTAAHCSRVSSADTSISDPKPKIVRLGGTNIKDMATDGIGLNNDQSMMIDAKIARIIVHPQYAAPKKYFDIALVELAEQITFTKYVQPACLWGQLDVRSLGSQATVTGWGYTNSARTTSTPELQVAVLDFIDQNQCDALLKSSRTRLFSGLQPHQLCAGKLAGGVDACQGDSGGPLQVKISLPITTQGSLHHLVGVTSFGIGCAHENTPGVYTRIASFIDWIEDIVWGEKNFADIFQR